MKFKTLALLACLGACGLLPVQSEARADEPQAGLQVVAKPAAEKPSPFARVAILGASLSNGSGLRKWFGFEGDFAPLAATAIRQPGQVQSFANTSFFMNPEAFGEQLSSAALESDPTLLIALDFLFWYAFGRQTEEHRLERFERGLAKLERFECPIVLADLPDISMALEGQLSPLGGGPLISRGMIPKSETREQLNQRLRAWVSERKAGGQDVVVVAFDHFLGKVQRNEAFEVRGNQWPAGIRDQLLQSDLLHPTLDGSYAVLILMADAMTTQSKLFAEEDFRWTKAELAEAFPESSRPWREAWEQAKRLETQAREKQREERRRARKQKRSDS